MSASKVIFQKSLKELRIVLCQTSKSSQGTRDFIQKFYVPLKSANPDVPILIRECSNVQPKIFVRYEFGKELNASLANQNADAVMKQVADFASKS